MRRSLVSKNTNNLNCDVLVVGGGLAGAMAAITAAQTGVKVALLAKGTVGDSGSSARAGGIIAASFGHASSENKDLDDDPEIHIRDTLQVGCGLSSEEHVRALAEDAPAGVLELERLGVPFSKIDVNRFHQLKLPGNSRSRGCSVIGGGSALMGVLRKCLEDLGVQLVENITVLKLSNTEGQVVGAQAFGTKDGKHLSVSSKATVLATGGPTGLFRTVSGDNRNTGDGLIIGYEAGTQLANLEFVEFTLIFSVRGKILPMAGLAPFLSRGCTLVNKYRERFMENYYSPETLAHAGRAEMLQAVVQETARNQSPISIECSALSEAVWSEFERSQGLSILAKIREAGGDCRNDPIEVVPAAHSLLAGLVTNASTSTRITGLWAAGECATGVHGAARLSGNGLAACLVFGRRAGRNAARFALNSGKFSEPLNNTDFAAQELGNSKMLPPALKSLHGKINTIAESALGVIRESKTLANAEMQFRKIQLEIGDVSTSYRPVGMTEIKNLAVLGELMASAAIRRRESRGLHFRSDATNSKQSWRKWLIVEKGQDNGMPTWLEKKQLGFDEKEIKHETPS